MTTDAAALLSIIQYHDALGAGTMSLPGRLVTLE